MKPETIPALTTKHSESWEEKPMWYNTQESLHYNAGIFNTATETVKIIPSILFLSQYDSLYRDF